MNSIDVFGIGNPLIDLISNVSDQFLQEQNLEKDRMYLVDPEKQQKLLSRLINNKIEIVYASGGSCANTMIGIAQLGGKSGFTGKIGDDDHGQIYEEKLKAEGINTYLGCEKGITGSCIVLVTDDGSRTMVTNLGMSQHLSPNDLSEKNITQCKYLYLEGYLWDTESQKEAFMAAKKIAVDNNVKIAMTLSDPFCVTRHKDDFKKILKNNVDLVFCNQEEAFTLTDTQKSQEALEIISENVKTVIITLGSHGALIYDHGKTVYIDPKPVKVVDTTGAGDSFAAGVLFGITNGKSIYESGCLGALLASKIISQTGPRFEGNLKKELI